MQCTLACALQTTKQATAAEKVCFVSFACVFVVFFLTLDAKLLYPSLKCSTETLADLFISALCSRSFITNVLVFTQTKKQAHRMHIVLGLLGLKVKARVDVNLHINCLF